MSRHRVSTSFSQCLVSPLCNCLVKKINQGTDVLTHNCLPPLLALIILTSGKNNHKIKIAVASWQSAVGIRQFHCKYTNILIALTACMGREGVCEKVGPAIKLVIITYIIYIMVINMLVDFHHFLLFSCFFLFYALKLLIHYFQFVNFEHLFQPSYSPFRRP